MEAFDIVHTLSRYYGYTPQQAEPAYHCLLQAQALDDTADPNLTGLTCFFRMHNPQLAERIHQRECSLTELLQAMTEGQSISLPDAIEKAVCRVWVDLPRSNLQHSFAQVR